MLEAARTELNKKLELFMKTTEQCHKQLDKQRATWLLACAWVAENFHNRANKPVVRVVPNEYNDSGLVTFEFVLKNGEAWNELSGLLELLSLHGVPLDEWSTSEDAPNFSRTYSAYLYEKDEACIHWSITLALREGNLGGCRRVFVGKELNNQPSVRDKYVLICDDPT